MQNTNGGLNLVGVQPYSPDGFTYGTTTTENTVRPPRWVQASSFMPDSMHCQLMSSVPWLHRGVRAWPAVHGMHIPAATASITAPSDSLQGPVPAADTVTQCRHRLCPGKTSSGSRSTR